MYLSALLLLCVTSELNMNTAQAQSPTSPTSTQLYTPGKSILMPGNGVGTWREISLSRRSNAPSWQRDGRSLNASSAASSMVQVSSLQKCNSAPWMLSLFTIWLAMNN
ncbi:uncharacterized protein LOC111871134 [Cryptotermes secundus]|uniref:uncharacterized protein LOC111871134 n=1 Tax=Cryptotermes secundus TaxID=105785 RepID=UPI000CD7BDAA|nr:uncharacterized protein LOC111871134 [Cryptotermes secundus]